MKKKKSLLWGIRTTSQARSAWYWATEPEPSNSWPTTLQPQAAATTMPETYEEVKKRISKAIAAINLRENVNRNKIAQEFRVPVQRLQSSTQRKPTWERGTRITLGSFRPTFFSCSEMRNFRTALGISFSDAGIIQRKVFRSSDVPHSPSLKAWRTWIFRYRLWMRFVADNMMVAGRVKFVSANSRVSRVLV